MRGRLGHGHLFARDFVKKATEAAVVAEAKESKSKKDADLERDGVKGEKGGWKEIT